MLYIMYQIDRPDGEAIRAAQRPAHFQYLDDHADILVLGGAMLAEDGTTRTGSVLIINVPNREAAERYSANEPFRKAWLNLLRKFSKATVAVSSTTSAAGRHSCCRRANKGSYTS